MTEVQPTEETTPVVEINPDAAKSRTKAFFARHKNKLHIAGIATGGTLLFLAGRASKDVVEDVRVEIDTPEESSGDSES